MTTQEQPYSAPPRTWRRKFAGALRGWRLGVRDQSSFLVHGPMAVAVILAAVFFRVSVLEWCVLLLAVASVLAAELGNSAVESLAKAVTGNEDDRIAQALDIASGSVLAIAVGAALIGTIIFLPKLWLLL